MIMGKISCNETNLSCFEQMQYLCLATVKYFLFARTLFSRKFARAWTQENKALANNLL